MGKRDVHKWYWTRGLHDACIVGVDTSEFPFDERGSVEQKDNYDRNLLALKIDSSNAIYDSDVKEIKLYNYEILSDGISLKNREKVWWLSDRLIQKIDHYILEIDLQDFDSDPAEFTIRIKFERAEVERFGTLNQMTKGRRIMMDYFLNKDFVLKIILTALLVLFFPGVSFMLMASLSLAGFWQITVYASLLFLPLAVPLIWLKKKKGYLIGYLSYLLCWVVLFCTQVGINIYNLLWGKV